ncbi:MAG TPA: GGDEF domain-containing protein [Coriobacteriia bacterium]
MSPNRLADRSIDDLINPVVEKLEAHPALVVLIAVSATLGAAWIDRASGTELSLTALYLGPVAIIAWFFGRTQGRAWCLLVGAASALAELTMSGQSTAPTIIAWNTAAVMMLPLVVVEVLTRLHRSLEVERDLARTDTLTGVANTRSFKELAEAELERARRYGRTFTLASLDLDHFKNVNDTLGHAAGDRLIHDVGQAIRRRLRRVDIVARIGGDEFVVLLPETDAAAAAVALEHIRGALQSVADGYGPEVTASFGAVTFVSPPASVEQMLQLADVAMYQAKNASRDRIESMTISREPELLAIS